MPSLKSDLQLGKGSEGLPLQGMVGEGPEFGDGSALNGAASEQAEPKGVGVDGELVNDHDRAPQRRG